MIALVLALASSLVAAQSASYDDRYGRAPAAESVSYGYADVLRVDPVYETVMTSEPREECYERDGRYRGRSGGDPSGGTVLGAIIGGVIGNQVGKGDGRRAATVAGAVIGGAIGHDVDKNNGSAGGRYERGGEVCRMVEVQREERRVVGYDVEYRYRGEVFMSRLDYAPGERMRVRVSIAPAD
ncbi:MAG: glycine zipper 2TM domain-containing protein [Xanthomonadales bacterium]|nr:glycine zipper 2TM domain-containing protein [Xanthomonadales bacterium]